MTLTKKGHEKIGLQNGHYIDFIYSSFFQSSILYQQKKIIVKIHKTLRLKHPDVINYYKQRPSPKLNENNSLKQAHKILCKSTPKTFIIS